MKLVALNTPVPGLKYNSVLEVVTVVVYVALAAFDKRTLNDELVTMSSTTNKPV